MTSNILARRRNALRTVRFQRSKHYGVTAGSSDPSRANRRRDTDCLLEESGFEPSFPVRQAKLTRSCR